MTEHRTEEALEADRLRDRDTLRAGFRTIRLTGESLADEAAVAATSPPSSMPRP